MNLDQAVEDNKIDHSKVSIQAITRTVEALKAQIDKSDKPWYRQVSTLVALMALAFSFGTTFVSYQRTDLLDRHAAQVELRSLIQRIVSLPRENFDLFQKYKDKPVEAEMLSSTFNNENLIIAQQAASLLEKLPDLASGGEYFAVADGLQGSGLTGRAKPLYEMAAEKATNFLTAAAAYRSLGALEYINGNRDTAENIWEMAMQIFESRFPNEAPVTQNYTHAITKMKWAQTLASIGDCKDAEVHLDDAKGYTESIPKTPWIQPLFASLRETELVASSCIEEPGSLAKAP